MYLSERKKKYIITSLKGVILLSSHLSDHLHGAIQSWLLVLVSLIANSIKGGVLAQLLAPLNGLGFVCGELPDG